MEAVAEKSQKKYKNKSKPKAQSKPLGDSSLKLSGSHDTENDASYSHSQQGSFTENSPRLSKHVHNSAQEIFNVNSDSILPNTNCKIPNSDKEVKDEGIKPSLNDRKTKSVNDLSKNVVEDFQDVQNKSDQEQYNFEKFLDMNKQILYTLESIDSIPAQPANVITKSAKNDSPVKTQFVKDTEIRPYTEQQLNALYYNSELDVLEDFTKSFVEAELRCLYLKKHCLYDLLANYLKTREKITGNNIEIEQLRNEYRNLQLELWTIDTTTVSGNALCQDGRFVSATHEYNRSIFHRATFQNVIRILGKMQKLIYENHVLFSFSAEDLRLQIELYIKQTIENVVNAIQLNKNSPVSLIIKEEESGYVKSYINEIRSSISVLFTFQRKLIKDGKFIADARSWLTELVAVLLRVASYQDHLFLIHHVLRCPAGVSTWASSFIQVPLYLQIEEPFANYQINHLLSLMSVILSPVKNRKEFLNDIVHCQNQSVEASWVLIDSDGEEDEETGISLRENDLVAMLNQLPIGDMFRCVLLVKRSDCKDQYNINLVSDQHMLRFFAFSSILLKLLHQGLKTYCQPKYNQFSKRLSRFIRHVVQYTTDQWEAYLKSENGLDMAMALRLQSEYDAFFLRAIYCLYSSQKLQAWQFLAVVPYNMVTIKTLWKIYYFLHMPDKNAEDIMNLTSITDFRTMIWERELRSYFEEKLSGLEDAEVYYLLNTFANMALARSETDIDFIYSSTMDILQVGFVSQATQDTCSKSARILLAHLTSKYPRLLSNILKTVEENIEKIGNFDLYLYEEIPLSIWVLTDDDLKIIERLLLNYPVNTHQTKLARMILSRLNWDLLPYEQHCDTAVLVLKAVDQEPTYLRWGWQTILRLKLHMSDHHFQELGRVQELERCEILLKGVRECHPLACFVAILMTTWGHLVPLICSNGLQQLITLQTHQKHEAVLFALYQVMPIFITCQECIINCDKFQEILINLLNADRGYISYAKSFVITQDTVLQQFGNMVETQIVNYAFYDLHSPRLLVRLWMNSFVSIPNWNKDTSILYLLNVIIRTAFLHQDSLQVIYENFRDLYQSSTPQETGSIIGIFKWASGSSSSGYNLLSNSLAQYPWLAYIFLEIEHQEKEVKTGLWRELLLELSKQKGKINVDNAIKNAASSVKTTSFSSTCLCINRWAQQALDTEMNHPLLPLFWQKFFVLFLTRQPDASSAPKTLNFSFLKRIKKRLQETVEFYKNEMETCDNENTSKHYKLRYSIFQAFLFWLEEPRLQSGNLMLQSLPAQYEPKLLALIIQENSQVPWYEYLDHNQIISDQAAAIKLWRVANFREKSHLNAPLPNPGHGIESTDPVERITRRLASYDAVKPPPELHRKSVTVPEINLASQEEMFKSLNQCFSTLKKFAHDHNLNLSEQKALDCSYQELVPQLFSSVLKRVKKLIPCKGKNQTVLCSGPANIILEFQEVKRNERIDHEIQINRRSYESLLEKSLQLPPKTLYTASVSIQQCVRILKQRLQTNPETAELGVELFYHVLPFLQEEMISYLPAKSVLVSCLEQLGQSHICGVEHQMPRLLEWILKEPGLGGYLAPYFLPSNSGNSNMLLMYSTITKEMAKKYDIIFALISKFEIDKWLKDKTPNLSQRSQFIAHIINALSALGFDPPIEALMLHGLYRNHLMSVFEFQFPEHYGEILLHLLKASNGTPESSLIAESAWIDILNALAKPAKIHPKAPLRDQFRQYSQHQKMLSNQELLDTADLLARHFTQERLSYGLYGLYPRCRKYMDIFVLLLGMTGHGVILSMLNTHQGLLGDRLCEKIWPHIREMFAPWLIPYSMHNLKENMATWIQQLADDRSILLPWIPSDKEFAEKMINNFCECVAFILDTLPASFIILSYIWQWYVTSFAHTSVKDHVLMPIHSAFTTLPWNYFWPSMVDLEFMLRVIDQYLPECHSFSGYVFISVPWATWISSFADAPSQIKSRVYQCFLSLLVKLSIEPNIRKNHLEKARSILVQSESFNWDALEPMVFQHIMDWVVMSCNSVVIFKNDVLDLDYRLLCLLKLVSGYHKVWPSITPEFINKRQMYVKAHVKLLSVFVSRHKNVQNIKENDIVRVMNGYLNDFDNVVTTGEEMELLIKEILSVVNVNDISETAIKVIVKWIESHTGILVIKALLKTLGASINDHRCLAVLLEVVLTSYFNNNVIENNSEEPTWKKASELLHACISKPLELEQVLIEEGSVLTVNAILLQKVRRHADKENLLNYCIGCVEKLKPRESLESKVPLIWLTIINLALQYCAENESASGLLLYKFSRVLLNISEDTGSNKWGRGLLNAIGLTKSETLSLNFRFVCRAMAGYILAQLPEMKLSPQKVRTVANSPSGVGMPGGNTECPKVLLELDFRQSQGKIKDCAKVALAQIQDPANSLHNANSFLWMLLKQFYIKSYLKDIEE